MNDRERFWSFKVPLDAMLLWRLRQNDKKTRTSSSEQFVFFSSLGVATSDTHIRYTSLRFCVSGHSIRAARRSAALLIQKHVRRFIVQRRYAADLRRIRQARHNEALLKVFK